MLHTTLTKPHISSQAAVILILLGPPGSGKGTQAKRLTQEFLIPHVSTGDLFRENMKLETNLGNKAKEYIQQGSLVPDELVIDMLFDRVGRPDCKRGYLLDGFPRTISQAEAFSRLIGLKIGIFVINLDVPDEIILQRAQGRLLCKSCGTIYSRDISPPVHSGRCDQCDGEVYQRSDDKTEIVAERLKIYHHQTQPLIQYYDEKGMLTAFDGNQPPDVVHAELKRYIDHIFQV